MVWWWIGNAVLLLVIVPLVVYIANRIVRPAEEIDLYAANILQHGVAITGNLDPVPAIIDTRDMVVVAKHGVVRYGAALDQIL
ncbi:MAG: hypothetical protein HKN07_16130 [Acidimicrobiia bacterium]|nr:hypothetical protein [Acidimicrobiia bacterium]